MNRETSWWNPGSWPWRSWFRAPRTLRFAREGQVIIGIALFVGFAAVNTGNNLLFLGWGLVLSAIVISGVLSESTLRPVSLEVKAPNAARAGLMTAFGVTVHNRAKRSIFGIEVVVAYEGPNGSDLARAPYVLRMRNRSEQHMLARFTPSRRGAHRILHAEVTTRFPFGFFVKTRPIRVVPLTFWVLPQRLDVSQLVAGMIARTGESSAQSAGPGEDYFDLRAYRPGDDLRRIRWRRSARTGRLVVVETEATKGREVVLELRLPRAAGTGPRFEHAISVCGSVAEALLEQGFRVGLSVAQVSLPPRGGERQAMEILMALARLDLTSNSVVLPKSGGTRIAIVPEGENAPNDVDLSIDARRVRSGAAA